ncbi:hypothetical protein ACWGJ0_35950 [Streptomyces massasporeus]
MPLTPEQREARQDIRNALAEVRAAEAARAAAAAEPPSKDRDARLAETNTALAKARATVTEGQRHLTDSGTGAPLLEKDLPVLLLPVRLEARLAWGHERNWLFHDPGGAAIRHLLVRIVPDTIHTDAHDPALTEAEASAAEQFHETVHSRRAEAWERLVTEVGPDRALWVSRQYPADAPRRPTGWTRQAVARLLPDRWQVTVDLDGPQGPRRAMALGTVCPDPVPLSLDPLAPDSSPLDWITDFTAATQRGLGAAVPLTDTSGVPLPGEPVRVTALGVVARLDPVDTAGTLVELVDGHHMTTGVRFTRPGDPTTSSALGRAVTARRTAVIGDVLAAERQRSERPPENTRPDLDSRADRVATALGTPRLPWRVLPGALDGVVAAERELRTVLAAAIRPALTELVESHHAEAALAQYVDRIEATGPLPVLLVGAQPYGLLPVLPLIEREPPNPVLATVEAVRRAWWEPAIELVPRLGTLGRDSITELLGALGRDGAPYRFGIRVGVGGEIAAALAPNGTTDPLPPLEAAFGPEAASRFAGLRGLLLHARTAPLDAALTTLDRRAEGGPLLRPEDYLAALADQPLMDVLLHTPGIPTGEQAPLLYQLARAALVATVDARVRLDAVAGGGIDPAWLPGWTTPISEWLTESLWVAAERGALGALEMLQAHPTPDIASLRATTGRLARREPGLLETLLRHVLGLASRIDPWYTAAAWDRLIALRTGALPGVPAPPKDTAVRPGVHVGGYGVLEGFLPQDSSESPTGHIHAPGATQAITAAVLHAGHRQRQRDASGLSAAEATAVRRSAAVRLDAHAVRAASELLDGLRAGRPLAELLGARIEERLIAAGQQALLAPLRALFPSAQGPSAAGAVADGTALLEAVGFPEPPAAPGAVTSDPVAAADLTAALSATAADLDALGDLLLAEGVHQLTLGRFARSAGVADFAAAARVSVPEPQLPRTDRTATGRPVRVLLLLPSTEDGVPDGAAATAGWPSTPRSAAAPELANWVAAALPPTSAIGLWVQALPDRDTSTDGDAPPGGHEPASGELLRMDALLAGLDEDDPLRFGPLELVASADAGAEPGSALYARLERLATRTVGRPVLPDPARSDGLGVGECTVLQVLRWAAQLAKVLGTARPLTASDLALPGTDPATGGVSTAPIAPLVARARSTAAELAAVGRAADEAAVAAAPATDPETELATISTVLLRADLAGVRVAVPDTAAGARAALAAAAAETTRRRAVLPADPGGRATESELLFWAQAVISTVFGSALPVGNTLHTVGHPLQASTTMGSPIATLRAWTARAAAVRPQVRDLHLADLLTSATRANGGAPASPHAVRLPDGEWTPDPGPPGTADLVALAPADALSGALTGLVIDEWTESVPSPTVDTAVTFHQPAPSAAPPQLLLLAVPPANLEEWSIPALTETVHEALHLARLRAVDLADVGPNQLLPALVSTSEPPGPTAISAPPDGLAPTGLIGG